MSSLVIMSSLAVLPSAMLARIHSVWQIRQVCYITAAIWSFCFWDTPKEKKNKTNCQQILLLAQQTVLHHWSCLTEQRLIPGGQLIITPEKCLLLYNAGFTCSWRMNSVRQSFVSISRERAHLFLDLYTVLCFQDEGHGLHYLLPMRTHDLVYVLTS